VSSGKNRTHSTLAKYNLSLVEASDIFVQKRRADLLALFDHLPPETRLRAHQHLELLDAVQGHIDQLEARILAKIKISPSIQLIQSVPGPAKVLAIVIDREIGSIDRFSAPKNFTSYAGLVPKVSASAGRAYYGRLVKQCNTYLKWAYIEAANVIVRQRHHPNWRNKYVSHLYERIKHRKGHSVAVGATARYLADCAASRREATYWVLTKHEPYKEPPHWRGAAELPATSPSQPVPAVQAGAAGALLTWVL
jgi:transposase